MTNTLNGFGAPAPISGYLGGRVNSNAQAAGREMNPLDAGVRIGTGISMRDIDQYGPLGGQNSEARKIARTLGIEGLF
ncbi:hypothetical protein [Rhizobium leguminosarum]|uniref:hypothetical protein n=1 Tax=Rhizobium leguminosarum TaxID=384 RepID=UPI003F9CF937